MNWSGTGFYAGRPSVERTWTPGWKARAVNWRTWVRRLVTVVAAVVTLLVAVIVVGLLLPPARLIAVIGSVFVSFFTLHVVLAGLIGVTLALLARQLGGHLATTMILRLAILATVGAAVPLVALARLAYHYSAPISWAAHLRRIHAGPRPTPGSNTALRDRGREAPVPRYLSPG